MTSTTGHLPSVATCRDCFSLTLYTRDGVIVYIVIWYVAGSALNRRSAAHLWQTALNWLNSAVTAAEVWSLVSRCPQAHRQKSILWGTPPYLPSLPQNGSPHLARGFGPPVGFLAEPRPQAILGAQETRVGGRDLCSSYAVQTRQWLPSG